MPGSKYKAAIVGCGDKALSGYFPYVSQVFDLVATCDRIEERAKQTARIYEADAYFGDIDSMLAKSDAEVVFIITSMASHGELALKTVKAGRHVLLQKPFCTDMATGLEVVRIARERKLKVLVEPNYWQDPVYRKGKEILDQGHIGTPHVAIARTERGWIPLWGGRTFYEEAGGGMMFDMGVYQIGALVYLLGPAMKVSGMACISIPDRPLVYADDHFTNFLRTFHAGDDPTGYRRTGVGTVPANNQVYDNTMTLLEWPNNCLGYMMANSVSTVLPPPGATLVLCGDKGTIAFGMQDATSRISVATTDTTSPYHVAGGGQARAGWYHVPKEAIGEGSRAVLSIQELYDAIENNTEPSASMDYGMHVAEIMIRSFDSARTGHTRRLTTRF